MKRALSRIIAILGLALAARPAVAQEQAVWCAQPADCTCARPRCFAPIMFGDWVDPTPFGLFLSPMPVAPGGRRLVAIPASTGAFKIAENESVRPQDRVFAAYNYYHDVLGFFDLHREMIGFEKTFLDGNASVGMRLPFYQTDRAGGGNSDVDDLTVIFKYALVNDEDRVLSTGLALTLPTGPAYQPVSGAAQDLVLFQPFVGVYRGRGNWYAHGFSSILIPTDDIAPTIWFNDVGIGYYQPWGGRWLTAVVPTFEVHVSTPLNHRSAGDLERRRDAVDLTAGVHFYLGRATSLGVGVATPVTGPRPFEVEGLVNLNWRFDQEPRTQ